MNAMVFLSTKHLIVLFLMHTGPDTSLHIQVTVSWSFKVFAAKSPVNISINSMDLSPLLASRVRMSGTGVTSTYTDDLAVRLPVTLLPSGYYGAIFTNIAFNDSAVNVKLNFTMTYPGGQQYRDDVIVNKAFPPVPFSRAGHGLTSYTPLLAETPSALFLSGDQPATDLLLGGTVGMDLYYGYADNIVWASSTPNASLCNDITDAKRRLWCVESGFTIDATAAPPKNVLLSPGITVIGK